MRKSQAPPSVVVGIDGSKAAVRAALWAVDEAVSRDIPLRLVYAVDPRTTSRTHPDHAARKLAFADHAIRYALMAVESTEKPVKIEAEIAQARPTTALVRASQSAAMVCVGAVGFKRFEHGHLGSTAAALAHAGLCPVAIVRENDASAGQHAGSIVVETDESPGNAVLLKIAIDEARLRKAPLLAVTCWQSRYSDDRDVDAVADRNRLVRAQLYRRLARWKRRYPDLQIHSVAAPGSIVDYLAINARSIQLVVVRAGDHGDVGQLIGPTGNAALQHTDCSVLIANHQNR